MNTIKKRDLSIHLEISSNCNSSCLYCGRFVGTRRGEVTDMINPHIQVGSDGNMSMEAIDNIFDEKVSNSLYKIVFTGAFGDAQLHPKLFDILKEIGTRTSGKIMFDMETNGGMHSPEWWAELQGIISKHFNKLSRIIFSIDGTDDETHQMYRRGVNWNKVIANAKSYIKSGGNATWQMIEFEHNKHQMELAKTMSEEFGFMSFEIRRSRNRFVTQQDNVVKLVPSINNTKRTKISKKEITVASNVLNTSKEVLKSSGIKDEASMEKYLTSCDVSCEWKSRNAYSIDYDGRVWQCCYFSMMLHPGWGHTYPPTKEELEENLQRYLKEQGLDWYLNQYEPDWNDINHRKFSDIIEHRFFTEDLETSFENKYSNPKYPRITRCSERCGPASIEFDKKHHGRDFREKLYEGKL